MSVQSWLLKEEAHLTSSSSAATLPLTIVENCSHGKAEIVQGSKLTSVELLAPPGFIHCLPTELSEQYQHDAMNTRVGPWTLVRHNLISCKYNMKRIKIRSIDCLAINLQNKTHQSLFQLSLGYQSPTCNKSTHIKF